MEDIEDAPLLLAIPDFQERFARGDSQILGRHALGIQASYPISDVWSGSLLILGSLTDGSGLISPSLSWDFAENVTFVISGTAPWGDEPSNGLIQSEYGGTPLSLFLQLSIYH